MIIYFSDTAGSCREQAAIAQSVVRNIGSVEVTGSIPVSSLKKEYPFGYSFFVCRDLYLIGVRYRFCGCLGRRSSLGCAQLHFKDLLLEDFLRVWRCHEHRVMRTHLCGVDSVGLRKACEGGGKVVVLEPRGHLLNG